jgi:uncharacterized protein (DUF362 family)
VPLLHLLSQHVYDRDAIKAALRPVLEAVPLRRDDPGAVASVLLKPNFVMPAPRHDASTTHPEFYMAVAELMLERGLRVGIGESPAIGSCRQGLRAHGVLRECERRGIEVVEFRHAARYEGVADVASYQELTIAAELGDWDALVNLPKLKTHQQFTFTAATKNLYGCVTGKRKFIRHNRCANDPVRFAGMLLANAGRSGCVLHVCDAIEALHVKGPRGGKPFPMHRVIVADEHLAHDWLCCRMIGLDPAQTPLFRAVSQAEKVRAEAACAPILANTSFEPADGFVHALRTDISFSPAAIARSGYRRLRHALGRPSS